MYLIRSNWPAVEDHKSLPLSHWFSSWQLLAHERAVPSLAEESLRSLAGVVGSASCPPAAAGPVNRAVDHMPCSLYLSTAHQYLTLTCSRSCLICCSSSTVLLPATPATGKPFLLPSLSMSWYTVFFLSVSFFNIHPTLHSPSPPWTGGEELYVCSTSVPLSVCASVTKAVLLTTLHGHTTIYCYWVRMSTLLSSTIHCYYC